MDLTGGHPNGDGVDDGCVLKDGRHVVNNDDSRRLETSLHSEGSIIPFFYFSALLIKTRGFGVQNVI